MAGRHRKPVDRVWPIYLMPVGAAGVVLWHAPADPPPAPVVPITPVVLTQPPIPAKPVFVAKPVAQKVLPQRIPPIVGAQGLRPAATALAQLIQQRYPDVPSIGGWRPDDGYHEHSNGVALDVMVTSPAQGDRICADMLATPGVRYVIWAQRIRYPSGVSRLMPDRGSANANHYNHVHINVVGVL